MKLNRKNLRRLILKEMAGIVGSAGGGFSAQVDQLIQDVKIGTYGEDAIGEYDIIYNNLHSYSGQRSHTGSQIGAGAISFYIRGFDESMMAPNRFYTAEGGIRGGVNPGVYWGRLSSAVMNPDNYDVAGATQTLLNALFGPENPHGMGIFTPTGAGRAAAILHFLRDQGITA